MGDGCRGRGDNDRWVNKLRDKVLEIDKEKV